MSWFHKATGRRVRDGFLVGIELELEGCSPHRLNFVPTGYTCIQDNSLRNGVELVSSSPMSYQYFLDTLGSVSNLLNSRRFTAGPRTSTHIHVNISDMTAEEFKSFLWLSVAMENVLLEFCSELRRHNGYCLSIDKANNLVRWWRRLIRSISGSGEYPSNPPKYAALGMHRIYDLGTLEFRMFPGCKDALKLKWYVDILKSIYDQSKQYTVQQLQDLKIQQGVLALLSNVILDNRKRVTLERLASALEAGIRNANDLMRIPMDIQQLKEWHRSLFPNLANELTIGKCVEHIRNGDVSSIASNVYERDSVVQILRTYSSYELYKLAVEAGVDAVVATRNALELWTHLSLISTQGE